MKLSVAICLLASLVAASADSHVPRSSSHRMQRLRRQEVQPAAAGVIIVATSSMLAAAVAGPTPVAEPAQAAALGASLITSSIAAAPTAAAAAAVGNESSSAGEGESSSSASESSSVAAEGAAATSSAGEGEGAAATTTSAAEKAAETGKAEAGAKAEAAGGSAELDVTILQFANLAEQLEGTLYAEAAKAFSAQQWLAAGFNAAQVAAIQESLTVIGQEESTHESVLATALTAAGAKPVDTCSFDFSSVLTDPITTMLSLAVIEQAGVAAYSGAAPLISDPAILSAAASILTTESRHQTLLSLLGGSAPLQNPFDFALTPQEVSSLINGFLVDCTSDDLGIKATESLVVANADKKSSSFAAGDRLVFASTTNTDDSTLSCQFLSAGASKAVSVQPIDDCKVPNNLEGSVWMYITSDKTALPADPVARSTAKGVVAGPAHFFSSPKSVFGAGIFSDLSQLGLSPQVNVDTVFGRDAAAFNIGGVQSSSIVVDQTVNVRGEGGKGSQTLTLGQRGAGKNAIAANRKAAAPVKPAPKSRAAAGSARSAKAQQASYRV